MNQLKYDEVIGDFKDKSAVDILTLIYTRHTGKIGRSVDLTRRAKDNRQKINHGDQSTSIDYDPKTEILVTLEEKVAAIIAKQGRIYHRLCDVLKECRGLSDRTADHLENLKKSILHVKTIPINRLLLNYCYTKAKNDRRMLREARKMISIIGLDDPKMDAEAKREIDQKIRGEGELQDFIERAEYGVGEFRKMWDTFETNINAYKAVIEGHNVQLRGMLDSLHASIAEECGTKQKFSDLVTLTVFSVVSFIMYWRDP